MWAESAEPGASRKINGALSLRQLCRDGQQGEKQALCGKEGWGCWRGSWTNSGRSAEVSVWKERHARGRLGGREMQSPAQCGGRWTETRKVELVQPAVTTR